MEEFATQPRGTETPPPEVITRGPQRAFRVVATVTSCAFVAWGCWAVLWDLLSFPGQLTRFVVVFVGGCPAVFGLGILVGARVMATRGEISARLGRASVAAMAVAAFGAAALITNLPMKARFRLAVAGYDSAPPTLSWPEVGEATPTNCGLEGKPTGWSYRTHVPPGTWRSTTFIFEEAKEIYYCPNGIDTQELSTNHSYFEHMVGPWWIDWFDG